MSPEQARGKAVDARADLWAFGCVLYEMLAGRRAFDGETASDAISSVLAREPDWDALPASTPAARASFMRRCLAKDVTKRIRHAGDAGWNSRTSRNPRSASPEHPDPPIARVVPSLDDCRNRHAACAAGARLARHGIRTSGANGAAMAVSSRTRTDVARRARDCIEHEQRGCVERRAHCGVRRDGRRPSAVVCPAARRVRGDASPRNHRCTSTVFSFDGQAIAVVNSGGEMRTISLADGLQSAVVRNVEHDRASRGRPTTRSSSFGTRSSGQRAGGEASQGS